MATAAFSFLLLFKFHAAVLEPDFDLSFSQVEKGGHLDAARSAQVSVEMKLLLEFYELGARVGSAGSFRRLFC